MSREEQGTAARAAVIVGTADRAAFSIDQHTRWRRALGRAGIEDVRLETDPPPADGSAVLVRADLILEEVLTKALTVAPDAVLVLAHGETRRPVAAHLPAARLAEGIRILSIPQGDA